MPEMKEYAFTCAQCGKKQMVSVPESINAQSDAAEKQRLMDGTLFEFTCSCGHRQKIDFPVLYHDPDKKVMMYHVRPEAVAQTEGMFHALRSNPGFAAIGYRCRIVIDQEALREKALLFDLGLDDRIMEIIKLTFRLYMRRKYPDKHASGVSFFMAGGKQRLRLNDTFIESEIEPGLYDQLLAQYAGQLETQERDSLMIGFDWAVLFLGYDKA